jgi:hypothetical protein
MKRLQPLTVALGLLFTAAAFGGGVTLPDAERIVLENGTVLILNENHDVPLIGLRAVVRGGASADPADKHGLANLLANLLEKGSGDRNAAEFAEAVAAVGGQLNTAANIESITISASFMADDGALLVGLVSDMLQRPALESAEFKKLRERSINLIKAAKGSDPGDLMPDYANAFLFGEHPYGNPIGGSESSLAKIRHADLMAYRCESCLPPLLATGGPPLVPYPSSRRQRWRTAAACILSTNPAQRRRIFISVTWASLAAIRNELSLILPIRFSVGASPLCC